MDPNCIYLIQIDMEVLIGDVNVVKSIYMSEDEISNEILIALLMSGSLDPEIILKKTTIYLLKSEWSLRLYRQSAPRPKKLSIFKTFRNFFRYTKKVN